LDALLEVKPSEEDEAEWTIWQSIKAESGKAGLNSVKEAASQLNLLRKVGLSANLFKDVPPKLLERYAKRASVEEPFELRRHAEPLKVTLMTAFLHRRSEDLTDILVDLLVETVHKMGKKAERRIDVGLDETLKKAAGKMAKLYRIAKAADDAPKGIIEEVIFPAAPEKWLLTLIQEVEKGSDYRAKVRTSLQRSYRFHYRRMVPELLNTLEFRCTNARHQPVMQAIEVLKSNLKHKGRSYPKGVLAPLKAQQKHSCGELHCVPFPVLDLELLNRKIIHSSLVFLTYVCQAEPLVYFKTLSVSVAADELYFSIDDPFSRQIS
jgi:hypothetical protein